MWNITKLCKTQNTSKYIKIHWKYQKASAKHGKQEKQENVLFAELLLDGHFHPDKLQIKAFYALFAILKSNLPKYPLDHISEFAELEQVILGPIVKLLSNWLDPFLLLFIKNSESGFPSILPRFFHYALQYSHIVCNERSQNIFCRQEWAAAWKQYKIAVHSF